MAMRVLVLRAPGITCDGEVAAALELAGAQPERIHLNRLADGSVQLQDYGLLIIPGGFAYGDQPGAGRVLAVKLIQCLNDDLHQFVADGRPVLGIGNGFQVLVHAGLLPGGEPGPATLSPNLSDRYECRWIHVASDPASPCVFTRGIEQPFDLPVGHSEGRFSASQATVDQLIAHHLVALRYVDDTGQPTAAYPANPAGASAAIAGICNQAGNVFGLMPHPDRAFLPQHHPQWRRQGLQPEGAGMRIFRNALRAMHEI